MHPAHTVIAKLNDLFDIISGDQFILSIIGKAVIVSIIRHCAVRFCDNRQQPIRSDIQGSAQTVRFTVAKDREVEEIEKHISCQYATIKVKLRQAFASMMHGHATVRGKRAQGYGGGRTARVCANA